MTLITAVINNKGGVGKTTTATNLATGLTLLKQKVLVIDLDPQGNIAYSVGIEPYDIKQVPITVGDLLYNPSLKIDKAIIKTKFFDLIANNMYTYQKTSSKKSNNRLKELIDGAKLKYDHIILDTPPSIDYHTINGIVASDILLIVSEFSKFSMVGVKVLVGVLNNWSPNEPEVAAALASKPQPILFTLYDSRTTLTKTLENLIEKESPKSLILETRIPRTVKVQESAFEGVPSIMKANNPAGKEYKKLAETWYLAGKTGLLLGKTYRIDLVSKKKK